MEKKTYPIITISREYAAYGRTIAAALSDRLGIPYYAKDFVKKTAEQSGYSEEDVERESENMSRGSKFMNNLLNNASSYKSSYDAIFAAQREVVLELAKEPCILVGRCADHILREKGISSFNIFLYADIDHRILRAKEILAESGELEDKTDADVKKIITKIDSQRETYYKKYTGKELGSYKNYDISLNVGTLGVDKCIEILTDILV